MKNIHVRRILMTVMVAGALVGCGSKEVQTVGGNGTTTEASAVEATVEENAVDAAASTEERVVEETVAEEVEPQTETRKVLAGSVRFENNEVTDIMSYIYDENGEVVKAVFNDYTNDEVWNTIISEELSADDFMNFGEKYVYEYIDVTKSENGRLIEGNWFAADGTDENDRVVYTYNDAGSQLTMDEYGADWETHVEYTYDENGNRVTQHTISNGEVTYDAKSDDITSEVDEDGTLIHVSYASGEEVTWYYTTIEVPVQ